MAVTPGRRPSCRAAGGETRANEPLRLEPVERHVHGAGCCRPAGALLDLVEYRWRIGIVTESKDGEQHELLDLTEEVSRHSLQCKVVPENASNHLRALEAHSRRATAERRFRRFRRWTQKKVR